MEWGQSTSIEDRMSGLFATEPMLVYIPTAALVLRQNLIHLRIQQLRLSFSQPKFSKSKFDPIVEG
jgi:hypothetical protein